MNLMRQRDEISAMEKARLIKPTLVQIALEAPVFQWWCGERSLTPGSPEHQFMVDNILELIPVKSEGPDKPAGEVGWPRITPFEHFRISFLDEDRPDFDQWIFSGDQFVCIRCDTRIKRGTKLWQVQIGEKGNASVQIWNRVNEVPRDIPDEHREIVAEYAAQPMVSLAFFLFDIYSGATNVIKVSPDEPKRSVQWRKAREHYLVLHHKQTKELQRTGRPANDGDLIRSAHWRRAHLRRLSSGRFVNKRGLYVPVRKAWVGPEEWRGKDGKIYTVVGIKLPPLTGIS